MDLVYHEQYRSTGIVESMIAVASQLLQYHSIVHTIVNLSHLYEKNRIA